MTPTSCVSGLWIAGTEKPGFGLGRQSKRSVTAVDLLSHPLDACPRLIAYAGSAAARRSHSRSPRSGAHAAIAIAQLVNRPALAANDFQVI
jgi:hypothetical protein